MLYKPVFKLYSLLSLNQFVFSLFTIVIYKLKIDFGFFVCSLNYYSEHW